MIPETLLKALQLIYEGRYGGTWNVNNIKQEGNK